MLSRLISSTHRITVDIEAVLTKRISIISLNLKYCLLQNISISVTFLELYTLSFLIFRWGRNVKHGYQLSFFKTLKTLIGSLIILWSSFCRRFLFFTRYMAFVWNFSRKGFFTVFLHNWVVLFYLFLTVMATSSVDF